MSFAESLLDLQWLCVLTLFMASVVTLLVYFVQYFLHFSHPGSQTEIKEDSEEAEELLCWTLGLKSWRSEWRRAWFRALNQQSKAGGHIQLTFEEDGVQTSELSVGRISSFTKSAGQKNVQCAVFGEKLQFSLSASPNAAPTETPLRYSARISPLQLQLALQLREVDGQVQVTWAVEHLDSTHIQLTPSYTQGVCAGLSEAEVMARLRKVLSDARPSVNLSSRPAQPAEVKEVRSRTPPLASPPKPPRAHEWKLLVKNIRVTCVEEDAAGSVSPQCVLQLDDPPQKLTSSVLANTHTPSWEQPFIFELSGKSKELNIQVLDSGSALESCLLGQVCVPFDLVKRHPRGQQTFALMDADRVTGSLTSEFTYLEPSEVRTWQPPTPAPSKRVEMDRTVMPCGTVVTTITAVKSRPGRPLPPETPSKSKLSERRVSEQPSKLGAKVSKALSSSDTELLMLNGTDPVAEAAIRQLYESAKQKHKSPVKKSTIIISGVTKAPLSQDEEMALMAGYAAAMDASMSGESDIMRNGEEMTLSEPAADPTASDVSDPLEGPSRAGQEDWESQAGEDPDADKTSLSLCMSETGSKKGKGSFLHKSAKLFFRRRHQRKEPGMSQSHNDLQYLEQPPDVSAVSEREKRTATFRKIINRKLLPKSKSKANGTVREPPS
ncbi:C2 domain-containing protein 2 isoform X2 [Colossoma macropomum]|uniref:C2 domain-containing protein 2 isoform X2 n=1 Tax=Colossoma macropomum TaxID=42526 RepID=UPI0018651AD0|nr:C2 domain-containing protein 2 isoform X2 [Colossoma macropomum]